MQEQRIGALVEEKYDHPAPRYLREFFNSFTAVKTSSNSNAESAQWTCFCAREIDWSSSKGGGWHCFMVGTEATGARVTGGVLDGKAAGCGIWALVLDGP